MTFRVAEARDELLTARRERRTLTRFTDDHPDLDADWGLAVQAGLRFAHEDAGDPVVGAKLGLTSAAKQRTMGVHEPIVGFLTAGMDLARVADRSAALAALGQPRVEPEVAFVLARDLAGPVADEELGSYVAAVATALEVLDSRWTGYSFRLPDVLADNTSAAAYVVGEPVPLPDDLASREARWLVDGALVTTTSPAAILGDPLAALGHLASHLGMRDESLPAGAVVLAGAMTDAVALQQGRSFTVEVDGLPPLTLGR
jgi:2-oxo-3-hexenedioate decarboxylase